VSYYLDEFLFRFNERRSGREADVFFRLICFAVGTDPLPYRSMSSAAANLPPAAGAAAADPAADGGDSATPETEQIREPTISRLARR
jgi:hypothetical protein